MRKLTVKRKKTFVAMACGIYIYVQCDGDGADLILDGIPCKNMGKLKNGKELTVDVTEEEFKAFVVFSRTQPQNYHSAFAVPAGGDVTLYTKPHFNPALGNPFTLSNVEE